MTDRFQMILQALVTGLLLMFAFLMEPRTPGVSNMVTGVVIAHWLQQSSHFGRADAKDRDADRIAPVIPIEEIRLLVDEEISRREGGAAR